ncbi:MAG TPA: Spy/CpxP family protein refolding chaperone [Bryobacteraceae bacterium]|jgi:Spy/CpxP family protein refolding chaperone
MRLIAKIVLLALPAMLTWGQKSGPVNFPMGGGHPSPSFFGGPSSKWWNNPEMIRRLGLTAEQQKKMDEVLQQSRLRLIDLSAALEKEEVVMEGLMRGPQLDDARILPEVDRIAQARAELEKANARLILGIRHVLTPEQWEKLSTPEPYGHQGPGPHGPGGPGGPPPGGPGGPGGPRGGGPHED